MLSGGTMLSERHRAFRRALRLLKGTVPTTSTAPKAPCAYLGVVCLAGGTTLAFREN